ncbi:MAG: patatin-like phospholipase family protein [Polyangiaceae bacterium]
MSSRRRVALVLAGGAARGAYEVGVVDYVLREVAKDVGPVKFDILCGTSVGALNACALAAFADQGVTAMPKVVDVWGKLDVSQLVSLDLRGFLGITKGWLAKKSPVPLSEGGLIDPTALEHVIAGSIPFERIGRNIAQGHLDALTVSTTHVASGKTIVYIERADKTVPRWSRDPTIEPRAATITAQHALASASVPILFRAVNIDGEYHCDGGLRQNVPLSPARRLGADSLLIVNPRRVEAMALADQNQKVEVETFPSPFFLLGKTLNALLLDRIDTDLARLESINRILEAGESVWGDHFCEDLNHALGYPNGLGFRPMRATMVRASEDIGMMASAYVKSARFSRVQGMVGRLMRRIAASDSSNEADLLSYLLFDGPFALDLIELGRSDAKKRHEALCRVFAS